MINAINLEKYFFQINTLSKFYSYYKIMYKNEHIRNEIKEQDLKNMYNTAKSIKSLKIDSQDFIRNFRNNIELKADKDINKSIDFLRQQILVSTFSIFGNFLVHVVKVYLNIFPKMLKKAENNRIKARDIAELKDINLISQYILEKEIIYFDRLSLKDKKTYLGKKLKFTEYDDLWKLNDKELWIEINDKRNLIVHSDEIIELSEEQFASYLFYFERIIFGIALYAKYYQSVDFIFAKYNEKIPSKERSTLKW